MSLDYSKTVIYKIYCNDPNVTEIYIGSTTNLDKRKKDHKNSYTKRNGEKYNFYVYQFIRANGGWNNWSFEIIEKFPCDNKYQAFQCEKYWIKQFGAQLNKLSPISGEISYENVQDKIIKSKKEKLVVDLITKCNICNTDIMVKHMKEHKRSQKHQIKLKAIEMLLTNLLTQDASDEDEDIVDDVQNDTCENLV